MCSRRTTCPICRIDTRALRRYLGLQITKERATRTITLTLSHMVQQVLQRFGLQFSTTQPTPLAVDYRIIAPLPDEPFEPSGPYAELVGCLMYLMTCMGLVFGGTELAILTDYCDSFYANDVETSRSTQGYCFSLGSGAVLWWSSRSSFVAQSSVGTKIYADAMVLQLTFLLIDLGE
ncbi:unnamed protein product [Closterium sp. NIES-53]